MFGLTKEQKGVLHVAREKAKKGLHYDELQAAMYLLYMANMEQLSWIQERIKGLVELKSKEGKE